jgi:glycosyltransferase involved in cell wall biosynthesis
VVDRARADGESVTHIFGSSDEDLRLLYNGALAYVSITLYPGAYLPPLEAMACGAPVILSDSSYIEAFAGATLAVNPLDPSNLATSLETIATDASLRNELMRKGFERASLLRAKQVVSRVGEIYTDVLAR